jgi:hypothetical protein
VQFALITAVGDHFKDILILQGCYSQVSLYVHNYASTYKFWTPLQNEFSMFLEEMIANMTPKGVK